VLGAAVAAGLYGYVWLTDHGDVAPARNLSWAAIAGALLLSGVQWIRRPAVGSTGPNLEFPQEAVTRGRCLLAILGTVLLAAAIGVSMNMWAPVSQAIISTERAGQVTDQGPWRDCRTTSGMREWFYDGPEVWYGTWAAGPDGQSRIAPIAGWRLAYFDQAPFGLTKSGLLVFAFARRLVIFAVATYDPASDGLTPLPRPVHVGRVFGHAGRITRVEPFQHAGVFLPDHSYIETISEDGTRKGWDLSRFCIGPADRAAARSGRSGIDMLVEHIPVEEFPYERYHWLTRDR